ncbi:hypothetical protein L249_1366 [Ophiocordyceps polyrhachis-furcata BCC 54312]|uniref:Uncharacterized protein n=1 Tax=Ophiocordyceps polyrhachis-furcata BCC 54312 TaxID=1330021 RepID=A0A367KZ01_9HYPO|nr:hypothetical protein L249_1366 [Ophiocordyceps polyrhachis-furcata BCC 54312]
MRQGISLVRLSLGILLHEVSKKSCSADLAINGFTMTAKVSGKLGGLVCDGGKRPPAWIFDDGGLVSTISHLTVPSTGGYVFRPTGKSKRPKKHVLDNPRLGWDGDHLAMFTEKRDEQRQKVCLGSLRSGNGSQFQVSFQGRLGTVLCSGFLQLPRVRTTTNRTGWIVGLGGLQLSRNSTVGIHRTLADETLVVGVNRSVVWPGLLDGSNWGREDVYLEEAGKNPNDWSDFCSSRCAGCTTPLMANCKGELTTTFPIQDVMEKPAMNSSMCRRLARLSWVGLRSEYLMPEHRIESYVRPECEDELGHDCLPELPRRPVNDSLLGEDERAIAQGEAPPSFNALMKSYGLFWLEEASPKRGVMGSYATILTVIEAILESCHVTREESIATLSAMGIGMPHGIYYGRRGAESVMGVKQGHAVVEGAAAARLIAAGGLKELASMTAAGGTVGMMGGAIISSLYADLIIATVCGLVLGTTQVGYNHDSEAGRGIDAWKRKLTGREVGGSEMWDRLWSLFPLSNIVDGLVEGNITVGINRKHPMVKLFTFPWNDEC